MAFTNEIFREVMRQNPGKILYTAETALYPGADYPKMDPMTLRPELLLLDLDEDEELMERVRMTPGELEAELTGQRILKMVGKEEIFDKTIKGMRKIEFKDIVILFRSPSAFAESYGKVLENMGIPVYVGTRSGYFSTREVQVVLSLLKIIDNSSQDIPLAAVLLSSIGGFTKKETALIRSSCGRKKPSTKAAAGTGKTGRTRNFRKNWRISMLFWRISGSRQLSRRSMSCSGIFLM
ncbi:MAG: 3'-5' exonuclease [Lachnospiraceae bacterium]